MGRCVGSQCGASLDERGVLDRYCDGNSICVSLCVSYVICCLEAKRRLACYQVLKMISRSNVVGFMSS